MSWQTLCNEKDTEISELRQRHAESQLSQQADSQRPAEDTVSRHQCTCGTDTDVCILISLFQYLAYDIYTVCQIRPPFYFSNNSVNDFWCAKP